MGVREWAFHSSMFGDPTVLGKVQIKGRPVALGRGVTPKAKIQRQLGRVEGGKSEELIT